MKVWYVEFALPKEGRERKHRIARYAVMAETGEAAVQKAASQYSYMANGAEVRRVEEYGDDVIDLGLIVEK